MFLMMIYYSLVLGGIGKRKSETHKHLKIQCFKTLGLLEKLGSSQLRHQQKPVLCIIIIIVLYYNIGMRKMHSNDLWVAIML